MASDTATTGGGDGPYRTAEIVLRLSPPGTHRGADAPARMAEALREWKAGEARRTNAARRRVAATARRVRDALGRRRAGLRTVADAAYSEGYAEGMRAAEEEVTAAAVAVCEEVLGGAFSSHRAETARRVAEVVRRYAAADVSSVVVPDGDVAPVAAALSDSRLPLAVAGGPLAPGCFEVVTAGGRILSDWRPSVRGMVERARVSRDVPR